MRAGDFEERLDFWVSSTPRRVQSSCWTPSADVYREEQGGWLIKVELAGVRANDVQVRLTGQRLTISGIRRDDVAGVCSSTQAMEIQYDRFERSIELDEPVETRLADDARLRLDYRDGMLLVQVTYE